MMRDWAKTQKRYLTFDLSHQLGHIASTLGRIKSQIDLDISPDGISATIQEGQHLIEWVVPNVRAEIRDELVELKQRLAEWDQHLLVLDFTDRSTIAEQAQAWSVRIFNHSGLLSEQDSCASVP